jgi:hemolysin activation/secretion protein
VRAQPVAPPEGIQMIRPGDERLPEMQPEVDPEPELRLPPVKPPEPEAPISVGPTFVLRGVEIDGNTVIGDTELQAVIKNYLDRPISTTQLQELRRALTMVYIDAGYINSGAVLPDQQVKNGIVRMRIVEGELSEIEIEDNKTISASYFTERIKLSVGPPLNVNELQERMQIMLEDPRIERINSTLEPGDQPGESKLAVDVTEGKKASMQFTLDNNRSPTVGQIQGGLHVQLQNFTSAAERLLLDWWQTDGLTDLNARLEVPVSPRDTVMFARIQWSTADVVEPPGSEIDVESESQDFELGISHPFYRGVGKTFSASVSLNPRRSQTFLLGRGFAFSPGVEPDGVSRVTPLRIGLNWLDLSRLQVIAARSVFSIGLPILNATENPGNLPDGNYFAWLGQAQWVRRWTDGGVNTVFRADMQLTPNSLLPLEKFTVGGPLSVRGYRTNQMVRDSGYSASAEVRIPIFKAPIPGVSQGFADGTVELAPFFDLGGGWETNGPTPDPTFISSVGAGLRWNISRGVFGSLYYAEALNNVPQDQSGSLQDDGISFQLVIGLF